MSKVHTFSDEIPIDALHTVGDWVRYVAMQCHRHDLYYGHGTDNAWDEAVALVLQGLPVPPGMQQAVMNAHVSLAERRELKEWLIKRIRDRIPVSYLTHKAYFAGLEFYVDERVLIPRSSLGELIPARFAPWLDEKPVRRILDLGTGSGCIAIACAHAFPEASVVASDLSSHALEVAKLNIDKHGLTQRVHTHEGDLFDGLTGTFDVIISNPPYVDAQDMASLPAEFHHEPVLGLAAGEDGLAIVDRLMQAAPDYLAEGGVLIVEVGNSEKAVMERYADWSLQWLEFERSEGGVFLWQQRS